MNLSRKELLAMQEPTPELSTSAKIESKQIVLKSLQNFFAGTSRGGDEIAKVEKELADLQYEATCDKFDQTMGPDELTQGDFKDIEDYFLSVEDYDATPRPRDMPNIDMGTIPEIEF